MAKTIDEVIYFNEVKNLVTKKSDCICITEIVYLRALNWGNYSPDSITTEYNKRK